MNDDAVNQPVQMRCPTLIYPRVHFSASLTFFQDFSRSELFRNFSTIYTHAHACAHANTSRLLVGSFVRMGAAHAVVSAEKRVDFLDKTTPRYHDTATRRRRRRHVCESRIRKHDGSRALASRWTTTLGAPAILRLSLRLSLAHPVRRYMPTNHPYWISPLSCRASLPRKRGSSLGWDQYEVGRTREIRAQVLSTHPRRAMDTYTTPRGYPPPSLSFSPSMFSIRDLLAVCPIIYISVPNPAAFFSFLSFCFPLPSSVVFLRGVRDPTRTANERSRGLARSPRFPSTTLT